MLVATREPLPYPGEHGGARHDGAARPAGVAPRVARFVTVLQVVGSLLAIPVGLASAYSIYRANFSVETTCNGLRANIIAMIDKNVDAGARRILVRRDVERFEQTCGAVDPDAKAAFKALLAADRPAAPVAAATTRRPDALAKEVAQKPAPRPDMTAKPPAAAKANLAATAAPAQRDAAASDSQWLDAVRQALQTHGGQGPAAAIVAPATVPMPQAARQEATLPPQMPAGAVAERLAVAPALPPATTVAVPAMPPSDAEHPVPPASIPVLVPASDADAAAPSEQKHSRIANWIAHVPLLGPVIGVGRR